MELAQPGGEPWPQRRVDHPAGSRVLLVDPGPRDRIGGRFEAAKRIGDGDAVEGVDQIDSRRSGVTHAADPTPRTQRTQLGQRLLAAYTAAPSRPDSALR